MAARLVPWIAAPSAYLGGSRPTRLRAISRETTGLQGFLRPGDQVAAIKRFLVRLVVAEARSSAESRTALAMQQRVDLRIGNRFLAVLPGEGEVEVTLLSPTTGTSFPEGGGEALYVAAWWVRAEDGHTFKVEEPGLKPQP